MNTARFNFVAQRMSPLRKATQVFEQSSGSVVWLACGHSCTIAPHFHVTVGMEFSCRECGRDAARKLPEFLT